MRRAEMVEREWLFTDVSLVSAGWRGLERYGEGFFDLEVLRLESADLKFVSFFIHFENGRPRPTLSPPGGEVGLRVSVAMMRLF